MKGLLFCAYMFIIVGMAYSDSLRGVVRHGLDRAVILTSITMATVLDSRFSTVIRSVVRAGGATRSRDVLLFPLPSGTTRVSSPWGLRRDPFTGRPAWHGGVDLVAAGGTGAPVVAAHSGLASVGYERNSGWVVRVYSRKYTTAYCHLSSALSGPKLVQAGDLIGTVGCTGRRCTAPHLHYSLRIYGIPVDPAGHFIPGESLSGRWAEVFRRKVRSVLAARRDLLKYGGE